MHITKPVNSATKTKPKVVNRNLSMMLGLPIKRLLTPAQKQIQEFIDLYPEQMRWAEPGHDGAEFIADCGISFYILIVESANYVHPVFVPVARCHAVPGETLYAGRGASAPALALRQLQDNMEAIVRIYKAALPDNEPIEVKPKKPRPKKPVSKAELKNGPTFDI